MIERAKMKRTIWIAVLLLAVSVCSFGQTAEQVIMLLYDLDQRRTRFDNEIIYVEEFNFGIPGGANWLVEWRDRSWVEGNIRVSIITMMYVVDIDTKEIKFRGMIGGRATDYRPPFLPYYESLPGVTRGDGTYQIGDFNGDGFDEKMEFADGASSPDFYISGYDPQEGKIKTYCSIPWDLVDGEYRIPPVEFIIYKGMQGFQVNYWDWGWVFYTWDEERRQFVLIDKVEKDGIESPWPITAVQDTSKRIWTPADGLAAATAEEPPEEEPYFAVGNESPKSRFDIRIVFIIGAAVLATVAILLKMLKKRKK
jgi:hypothetical protein